MTNAYANHIISIVPLYQHSSHAFFVVMTTTLAVMTHEKCYQGKLCLLRDQ